MRAALMLMFVGALSAPFAAQAVAASPGDSALEDVRVLSADAMEGRAPGSPGSTLAQAYIIKRFGEIGVKPMGAAFEHPFTFTRRKDGETITGVNLVGKIEGTSGSPKVLVISAHYDHLGVVNGVIFNGADDNASGVAGLLATAEAFKAKPPLHTVIFAVFDAEESGLQGAKAFVAKPPAPLASIGLNINFDMLSRNAKNELYVSGGAKSPALKARLETLAKTAPVTLKLGHDTNAQGLTNNWTNQSDHYAFAQKNIPWVYFGVEDHPDYHKATDDFSAIPQDFFKRSVATVIAASRLLDSDLFAIDKHADR